MAFWLYSSGSTGRPKGVVHAHGDIGVTVDQYARNVLQISDRRRVLLDDQAVPRLRPRERADVPAVGGGVRRVGQGPLDARPHLRGGRPLPADAVLLGARRCTRRWSRRRGAADVDFSSVRACVSAAEALPAAVLARWQAITGVPILDGIGSTEMLHIYCSNTLSDLAPGTSGRPVPGYELRLVDERGLDVVGGRGRRPDGPRRQLRRLLLAPAREDPLLHARRVVPHRRPLHRRRRRPLRLPGALGRHDQGRRAVGVAGRRRGLPGPPPGRVRGGGDRRPRSTTSAGSRRS